MTHAYLAYYANKELQVFAQSSFEAYEKAVSSFKAPKSKAHLVSVHFLRQQEQEDKQIMQDAQFHHEWKNQF